jgi:hypothetical protein
MEEYIQLRPKNKGEIYSREYTTTLATSVKRQTTRQIRY